MMCSFAISRLSKWSINRCAVLLMWTSPSKMDCFFSSFANLEPTIYPAAVMRRTWLGVIVLHFLLNVLLRRLKNTYRQRCKLER